MGTPGADATKVGLGIDFGRCRTPSPLPQTPTSLRAEPRAIRMDPRDNVAIVANEGGLDAGATFTSGFAAGLVLKDRVPAGHKVALTAIDAGAPVLRYGIAIGYATQTDRRRQLGP